MHLVSRLVLLWAFLLLCGSEKVLAWDTLPARVDDEPGFQYTPSPSDWRMQNIYQIMTDRFNDGDPSNNNVNGAHQPAEPFGIHGGDFAGIRQKLDYIQNLGVTAIWISPVQFTYNAYHGFAPTDFNRIETRMGSLQELRELVDDCHSRGIYVIIDIVINHMADFIYSTDAGYPQFNGNGYNLSWRPNRGQHAPPFNDLSRFHNFGQISDYSDPWQVIHGEFYPGGLDDIKTSDHQVRQDMIRIFQALIDATDCDGFRVDAVKHVEDGFYEVFMPAIYQHAAYRGKTNFIIFGEAIDGNVESLPAWTHHPRQFNSMLDFPMHYKMLDVFVDRQRTSLLTDMINELWRYSETSRHQLVGFLDNHDTWRIMYDQRLDGDVWRLRPALTFLYTSLQIPCLYYGTEQAFNGGQDPYNRENMFDGQFQWGPSAGDRFDETSEIYLFIKKLNEIRKDYPAVTIGAFQQRWQNNSGAGIYAYTKTLGDEEVLVALNTSATTQGCTPGVSSPNGTVFINLLDPTETVTVSGGTLNVTLLGHDQKIFARERAPLWVGNISTWPGPTHGDNATLEADEDLWIDIETRPIRMGQSVKVHYRTTADGPFTATDANWHFNGDEGSHWHLNLGTFASGTTIEFYVEALEGTDAAIDNNDGANFAITVTGETTPSELVVTPDPIEGCATVTLTYHPNGGPLAAAEQIYAHMGRNGWNDIVQPPPSLDYDPVLEVWTHAFTLEPGTTEINVVFNDGDGVWDNNNSQDWSFTVTGCDPIDIPTGFAITNPPTDIVVGPEVTAIVLQGIAQGLVGDLLWTNALTGESGSQALSESWSIADIELAFGDNVITVTGSEYGLGLVGMLAQDEAANYIAWTNDANEGMGFAQWTLASYGDNAGHFLGDNGFGFWSHDGGNLAEAIRPFGAPLAVGQTFYVRMQNGWVWEQGGSVGVALRNASGDTLWEFFFNGGDTNYSITGATTDIGWTDAGINIAFTLTGAGAYSVDVHPDGSSARTFTGTFEDGPITQFRAWSYNNGTDDEFNSNRDFYVNDLMIAEGGSGPGIVTNATITITRVADENTDTNGDGIPDWWYVRFGFDPAGPSIAHVDSNGNGLNNHQVFIADLHPNDPSSTFENRVAEMNGTGIIALMSAHPTSTNRVYDVFWKTNLVDATWHPAGLNVPGRPDGNAVSLIFTNQAPTIFLRTGVKLP